MGAAFLLSTHSSKEINMPNLHIVKGENDSIEAMTVQMNAVFDDVVLFLLAVAVKEDLTFQLVYEYPTAVFQFRDGGQIIVGLFHDEETMNILSRLSWDGDIPGEISGEDFVKTM